MSEFSDWMFFMGMAAGGVLGAAVAVWLAERKMEDEVKDWEELLHEQSGHIAELRSMAPRAVTKLTNRERTVEL
jgi:gas vesicle protein